MPLSMRLSATEAWRGARQPPSPVSAAAGAEDERDTESVDVAAANCAVRHHQGRKAWCANAATIAAAALVATAINFVDATLTVSTATSVEAAAAAL